MEFNVYVTFDEPQEIQQLRLLESLKGLVDFEKRNVDIPSEGRKIESDLKVFTRLMHNPAPREHVQFAHEIAKEIQTACREQSHWGPDPKWIEANDAAKAEGEVTLFVDPEKFCKDMRDLRTQQVIKIGEAIIMLGLSLSTANLADDFLEQGAAWK